MPGYKALQRLSSDADETGANGPEREGGDDDPQHDALEHGAHSDFAQSGLGDAGADEEERDGEAAAAELCECSECRRERMYVSVGYRREAEVQDEPRPLDARAA